MKITALKLLHVAPRWLLLRVETDEGVVGYGEPVVEGRARTVETAVRELSSVLIGEDPRRIEALWQRCFRGTFYRGGPVLSSAVSGVDQALWDIKGKWLGVPVHELLGGRVRDRVHCYVHVSIGFDDDDEAKVAEATRARLRQGFTALKTGVPAPLKLLETPKRIARVGRVFSMMREAAGPEVGIGIDFHGRVAPPLAKQLVRAIEPYDPLFIEEPVLPEMLEAMAEIARFTHIPIATGERMFSRWAFRDLFSAGAASIIQPDLCHAGGVSEVRRIAAMAEAYGAGVAPHNPLGPVSFAACLQIAACTPNFVIQEFTGLADGRDRGVGILVEPIQVADSHVEVTDRPGLGIEVDWARLEEEAARGGGYDGSWQTPQLTHEDGSFAEW